MFKKVFILGAVVILSVTALIGCGGEGDFEEPEEEAQVEVVEIV